jgi:predicted amidohydrolase
VKIALCQTNCGEDVTANEEQVFGLLERAAANRADLAALPEVWPRQGSAKQIRETAEPVPGRRAELLAEVAARHRMWVHGGSVLERDGERIFNTSVLFDRSGELVATYRKIHLFDADPPGAVPSRESSVFSAGDQVVTAETEFGRVGL